ncbi:MAG: hypothetical protein GYA23_00585 [Methanomicrobiales archaeon]|nr:hypothetical protein [Methanomicrobiales archaeon]
MRIAFFIHKDYNFTFDVLSRAIPELSRDHQVVGILEFPEVLTKYSGLDIPKKYLELFGPWTTMKLGLFTLRKRLGLIVGTVHNKGGCSSFSHLSSKYSVEYQAFSNPNDPEVIDWITTHEIDVVFIFIGQILKSGIIHSPKCCIVNKHSALLPANRGLLPVFWALLHDEKVGFTLHKVTEKIDDGEILYQKSYEKKSLSIIGWYERIYADVPGALVKVIHILETGNEPRPHAEYPASYHSLPDRADVEQFENRGLRII